ncbi:hypothetical protein BKA62DRAFT_717824 [Auriculariales sp. MPI-PUGE-AT-0066]|nr:hypothetical protein BKA62DRAFT_717824 [Auriculariales sp. MPI-PUGE-AT-0066]
MTTTPVVSQHNAERRGPMRQQKHRRARKQSPIHHAVRLQQQQHQHAALAKTRAREIRDVIRLGVYVDHTGSSGRIAQSIRTAVEGTKFVPADLQELSCTQSELYETEFDFRQQVSVAVAFSEAFTGTTVGLLNSTWSTSPESSFNHGPVHGETALMHSSTYLSVQKTPAAVQWYRDQRTHSNSHALLFSPSISIIRDNANQFVQPRNVHVVTAAAIQSNDSVAMRERATLVLRMLQLAGVRTIVLDHMCVDSTASAQVWAELLALADAPFHGVFERVVFAVPGPRFAAFSSAFELRVYEEDLTNLLLA